MMKLSDNPSILSPCVESLTELSGRWWVAHTRARNEKAFVWDLHRRDIGYFLPMVERTRIYNGKKQSVLLPLFSSYVFFCGSDADRYSAMTTNRLCQTIEVRDQQTIIKELAAIEKALAAKVQLDPYPFAVVGQRFRITGGSLKGMEGIVIKRTQRACFVLEVDILGRGTVMEIDADLIEPV
ncbi:MAG TPA: hypothetical protein ENH34_03060 [Phycisphaerales bacterium]|nr:hypothetical protein [Phycisphaerales bacterium]